MRNSVAVALVLAGGVLARLLAPAPAVYAEAGSSDRQDASVILQVINSTKTNDTLAFVYDTKTQRLALYTVGGEKNKELSLCSVRNTGYDVRIHELNNFNPPGTSLKELKKGFEDEDAKKKDTDKKAAEKDKGDKDGKDGKG
jgi:hypothetical protein